MVVIFDLDDTLYDESAFVQSGFRKVAEHISAFKGCRKEEVLHFLNSCLTKEGRGSVFDQTLKHYQIYSKKNVRKCLSIYRLHTPDISLPRESIEVLQILGVNHSLYVVTDGNKLVQRNKIRALEIDSYVTKAMPTHNYGCDKSKPSVYCFELIKKWEKADYKELFYIGDNPKKDFVNIKKLNINTIRINQGMYKDFHLSAKYSADHSVNTLSEIIPIINQLQYE